MQRNSGEGLEDDLLKLTRAAGERLGAFFASGLPPWTLYLETRRESQGQRKGEGLALCLNLESNNRVLLLLLLLLLLLPTKSH